MANSPGSQPPPWGGIQKSPTLMCFQELRKRDQILFHCFYHSRSLRVWGSCELGTVDEGPIYIFIYISVEFSCLVMPTLGNPKDCSMPVFAVLHQLLELTQTCVHRVGDVIPPSHPLLFPSSLTFNLSQHQGLFQGVSSSHQVPKY